MKEERLHVTIAEPPRLVLPGARPSPVGERIADHPWEQRTGRPYFEDLSTPGEFKDGDKIIIGGRCYIRYDAQSWTYGHDSRGPMKIKGAVVHFWEYLENPQWTFNARRLD